MENSRRSERFLGCRAVRGFYSKLDVGATLGGGEGQNPHYSKFACKISTHSLGNIVFKKVLRATRGRSFFYVALLGLFSRRFGAGKQVCAQSGFGLV